MIGIDKGPLISDLETVFSHVLVEINPKAIGRGEIIAVIVQNPLLNPDGTANNSTIFVGSASNMIYFMLPGQESPIIYAEDLKDIYMRLNFPAVNPNGVVLTATVEGNHRGLGYTVGDILTLSSKGDGNATVTVASIIEGVLTGAINNAGAGYVAGNILTIQGGSALTTIRVLTVDGGGAILTFEFVGTTANRGEGYSVSTQNLTGGAGVGATFDIQTLTNAVLTITVTDGGTGYAVEDVSNTTGGTGAGAQIVVLTVDTVIAESADIPLFIYRRRKGGKQ